MVSPGFHFSFVCALSAEDGAGCPIQFGAGRGAVEIDERVYFAVNAFFLCHPL